MMTTWCVDVSGSMSREQIAGAMDKVSEDWKTGDAVITFDHAQAEFISFSDVVDYTLGKDPCCLIMSLFKKGVKNKIRTNGADEAIRKAFHYSTKICVTDGFLRPEDMRRFGGMIIVNNHGRVIE